MKKIIRKFWGVGLILVLLSTLFIAAAPVSSGLFDPLTWEPHIDAPSAATWGLAPGTDILDFAASADGMVIYALAKTATTTYLLQTTSGAGGPGWTNISSRLPAVVTNYNLNYVALAPDDPNTIVVGASANGTATAGLAISVNGGATFTSMNFESVVTSAVATLQGVSVSPMVTGGFRYIAAFGAITGTNDSSFLYYYNYGAGVGTWRDAVSYTAVWSGFSGFGASADSFMAVQFSPNFPSDQMAVAVDADTGNATVGGALRLHILSFNTHKWDASVPASGYPATVTSSAVGTAFTVNKASLALLPDYDGGDESLRIAFVGADITSPAATEAGGVWRCYDYAITGRLLGSITTGIGINSVAFDGTNLAAGSYATNNVYRSADPLVSSPTVLGARNLKKIGSPSLGVADQVIVKFAGATLLGSKRGDASALSKSLDYGNVWNDFTLIDSGSDIGGWLGIPAPAPWLGTPSVQSFIPAGTISDIYYTATGDPWYLAAYDGTTTSVYRMSMFAFTRVLSIAGTSDFILRGLPSDPGVVYAAIKGGTDLYYTADGGTTRWYKRVTPQAVADLAVETKEIIYIGQSGSINVYKSSNSGFTWNTGANCKMSNNIYSLLSVGENKLLVGGVSGGVAYSTDGAATFTTTFPAGGTNLQIAASGLGVGDYIFVASTGSNDVLRYKIGTDITFASMYMPAATSNEKTTGIVLQGGVLYALSANATSSFLNRTLAPTIAGTHTAVWWGTRFPTGATGTGAAYNLTPSALKANAGPPGSIMLHAVNSAYPSTSWFQDNVYSSGPKITGPADKSMVEINTMSGNSYMVNVTFSRLSLSTNYTVLLSLDKTFTSVVGAYSPATGTGALDNLSVIIPATGLQPGTTYYWAVYSIAPLTSALSEVRSFTVKPGAAAVPIIGAPANGGTIDTTKPAFSWSPVSGVTMYQFQISEGTAFAAPIYDSQVANAGVQLPLTVTLEQGKTYFWRVRGLLPIAGDWSTIANFTVALPPAPAPAPTPPVVVQQMPAPVINIPASPPATQITIPPAPAEKVINPTYIWAIIIIGAVLVIAVIVLIVRTRRTV
jgi:hypothetical protein